MHKYWENPHRMERALMELLIGQSLIVNMAAIRTAFLIEREPFAA